MICFIEASIDNLTLIVQEKTEVVVMWGGREGGREGGRGREREQVGEEEGRSEGERGTAGVGERKRGEGVTGGRREGGRRGNSRHSGLVC